MENGGLDWLALEPVAGVLGVDRTFIMPDLLGMLCSIGLRPTTQRVGLARLLFEKGNRHLTAEMLHEEAIQANVRVSLATIYNTLNRLSDAGLLRRISVDGMKTYFDSNVSDHQHFYFENRHELVDIPSSPALLQNASQIPEGYEISRVDVVVRLRRKR
jgi:Fur family transcriptional regulator, iron response regulator